MLLVNHISEDDMEQFVMGHLAEREMVEVEEHLSICEECRELCDSTEQFILHVREKLEMAKRQGYHDGFVFLRIPMRLPGD